MRVNSWNFIHTGVLLIGMLVCAPPTKAGLLGIDVSGNLFSINTGSGASTLIGASGVAGTLSLGSAASGSLYTIDNLLRLDTLDLMTGVATTGPTLTGLGPFTTLTGVSFSPGGVLFASALGSELLSIDTTTGAATQIGSITSVNVSDLAFTAGGILYAWEQASNKGLATVNTTTGLGTLVNSNASGLPTITGLSFSPGGILFASSATSLYTIDLSTSAATLVGVFGSANNIRGLAFDPPTISAVPEPTAISLAGFGMALLALRQLRRR